MHRYVRVFAHGVLFLLALAGCQTTAPPPPQPRPVGSVTAPVGTAAPSYSGAVVAVKAEQPAEPPAAHPTPAPAPAPAPVAAGPLKVADLEQLALANNPTLVQAATHVDAARGKALQAGLPFNPTVGMEAEQIGAGNTAGEVRWLTLQQQIVTGGKLRLSRLKYEAEAELAEIQAQAQRLRVVNGIARAYFGVLAAQRSLENHRRQADIADEAVKTTEQLANLGQANPQDLLQAQVEASQARVAARNAEARLRQDWTHLATQVGVPGLPQQPLAGSLEPDGPPLTWDEALARLCRESPELLFAVAKVRQDELTVERERREPIPNVTVRGGVGYNFETRNNTADAAFSLPLPVFDRNQGTVRQAAADLTRSHAEVTRVQLDLQRRLSVAFTRYETARAEVENFRAEALPKARRAAELYEEQLRQRRAAFPQVLVARRTVLQLNEEYTRSLLEFRRAEVEVRGLLLVDGLTAPPAPTPPGHINATPRPR